jgi:hypothetical protein
MHTVIHRSSVTRAPSGHSRLRACAAGGAVAAIAVATLAAVAVAPAGAISRSSAAGAVSPVSTRACAVREHASFRPARVVEGHTARLVVVLQNCSGTSHTVELTQFGHIACLVADPIARQITITVAEVVRIPTSYLAPSCTGTGEIIARVTSSTGKQLASRVAKIDVIAPPPSRSA